MVRAGGARPLVPLALLLPLLFSLDRPVMIDDTLFLKAAAQILRDPLRPYEFVVNWYGWRDPFWDVFKNPPGVAYWLAAAQSVAGSSERVLHLAMLPFAVAAVLGGVWLARRFTPHAEWATAIWVASPAFLVAAASLAADVPALACSLCGLATWIDGIDGNSPWRRRLGGVLAGTAVVFKYTAVVVVLALAIYALGRGRDRRRGLVDLWTAALPALAWSGLGVWTAGRIHMLDALVVGGGGFDANPGWLGHRAIALSTFVGGAGVGVAIVALAGVGRRRAILLAAAAVAGAGAAMGASAFWPARSFQSGGLMLLGLLATAGILGILRALAEGGDRDGAFLAAWAVVQIGFLWLWSWTVAARFVLPLLIPLSLLLARGTARDLGGRARWVLGLVAATSLAVGVITLRADDFAGELPRRALPSLAAQARREGRQAWFVGAWGFEHYAEKNGLQRLDIRAPGVRPGDLVFQPYYVANNELPQTLADRLVRVGEVTAPAPPWELHTMNLNVGAGFHSSVFGPLPYVRANLPAEGIRIWLVQR